MTRRRRGTSSGALIGVLATGAIVGGAIVMSPGSDPDQTAAVSPAVQSNGVVLAPGQGDAGALPRGRGIRQPGDRCEGGSQLSMAALKQQSFALPILLPNSMSNEMTSAWVCPDAMFQPVVMYGNVEVSWDSGWSGVDLKSRFSEMASLRPHAEYTTFDGFGAFVNYPSTDAPLAAALVVVGDESVLIRSSDPAAMDRVLAIAKNVAASVPATG